ncbi:outer membrane protein assembly factor BamB [Luteimonas sp. BDR2-5]|uniref:outer membrane protein assembly factor BamB n=1 Tax=Proluteimonas luteida TaxID=2878685 RepID=UPI001E4AE849|nr:outer membrane protein assembly factor BamB [Luteimonas sp. BDR2-5]MCD9026988.1 outer membrane protein assembly factor BamB [Luteimonas sp. BDR2-5]
MANTAVPHASSPRAASGVLRIAAVVLCVVAVSGCSTVRGWFGGNSEKAQQKALSEPSPLVDITPTITVSRLWSANAGKGEGRIGARQGPAVADGRVYVAAIKGGVRALDLQSGATVWHHPSDLRLSGGPGVGDGLVVVGSLDGEVVALDAATGEERWQAKVGNEVIAAPAIGQGLVLVRSNDGRVTAFEAGNGQRRWFWTTEMPALTVRGNDAPVLGPGFGFVGNDDGSVVGLSLADGRVLWEQTVAQPEGRTELERMADIDGTPVLDEAVLFASSYRQQTMAIEGPSGRPLWASEHGGSNRPGVSAQRVVVSDRDGVVWALDKYSGTAVWQQNRLARRNLTGAAVQGEYAVVGDLDGYLHWLRLDDGEFAARQRAGRDPIKGALVVADGILVVQNIDGNVSAWRIAQ